MVLVIFLNLGFQSIPEEVNIYRGQTQFCLDRLSSKTVRSHKRLEFSYLLSTTTSSSYGSIKWEIFLNKTYSRINLEVSTDLASLLNSCFLSNIESNYFFIWSTPFFFGLHVEAQGSSLFPKLRRDSLPWLLQQASVTVSSWNQNTTFESLFRLEQFYLAVHDISSLDSDTGLIGPLYEPVRRYKISHAGAQVQRHSGTSKPKAGQGGLVRVALFWSPTVQLASNHVWFCNMWPDRAKGLLNRQIKRNNSLSKWVLRPSVHLKMRFQSLAN